MNFATVDQLSFRTFPRSDDFPHPRCGLFLAPIAAASDHVRLPFLCARNPRSASVKIENAESFEAHLPPDSIGLWTSQLASHSRYLRAGSASHSMNDFGGISSAFFFFPFFFFWGPIKLRAFAQGAPVSLARQFGRTKAT